MAGAVPPINIVYFVCISEGRKRLARSIVSNALNLEGNCGRMATSKLAAALKRARTKKPGKQGSICNVGTLTCEHGNWMCGIGQTLRGAFRIHSLIVNIHTLLMLPEGGDWSSLIPSH